MIPPPPEQHTVGIVLVSAPQKCAVQWGGGGDLTP
eukprot:SAG31_NODE_11835_length_993_cov_1.799776_1_plen_34_part_10